ncbi:hypothetical protein D5086_033279 [Populus alba]|uniref:Uncharacterized protein n=1 Tax=Populus alba TaxID=43335 RepID=A0ACC4AHB7_POPAL
MGLSFSVLLGTKASSPEPPNEQLSSINIYLLNCVAGARAPAMTDSPLHCYYWCKGDGRTVVDKGNLLGINIYTSDDAGSLLQKDWIVSTKMTGIYRVAIVAVEESIAKRASFVVYFYGPAKDFLPPEIRSALNLSEERVTEILRLIGATFQQVLRERDGIPDLRRATRFRCAIITLPEVDGPVRKLLKGGRYLDDILTAVVIQNLKAL